MREDKPFYTIDEWDEDDGQALFFKLDAGEPPEVTSPITVGFNFKYFTHWHPMPKVFIETNDYVNACIKSGIKTQYELLAYFPTT